MCGAGELSGAAVQVLRGVFLSGEPAADCQWADIGMQPCVVFSDLALKQAGGGGMLPGYDFVVLDEGHTVEAVASDHFGISVSESQVRYLLHSLFSKNSRGFLATLDSVDTLAAAEAVRAAEEGANRLFEGLDRWLEKGPSNGRVREKGIVADTLSPALEGLAKSLRGLGGSVKGAAEEKGWGVGVSCKGDRRSGRRREVEGEGI